MKSFLQLLVFFTSFLAFAGDPPVSLQGQFATKQIPKWNLQVPYSQATNMGGITALIESGNPNILANPSFENIVYDTSWTVPSGVVQTGTLLVYNGKQSLNGLPSAGVLATQNLNVVHTTSINYEYSYRITLPTTYSTNPTMQVCAMSGGSEIFCGSDIIPQQGIWSQVIINFPSPTSGTVGIRAKCIANCPIGGGIVIDDAYVGPARNIVPVSQGYRFGTGRWAATTSCSWTTASNNVWQNFTANSSCPNPTVTENATVAGTKIPGIVFSNMPAGTYQVRAVGWMRSATVQNACFRITDGTNSTTGSCAYNGGTGGVGSSSSTNLGSWTLTAPMTNVTVQMQLYGGAGTPALDATPLPSSDGLFIEVFYIPPASQQGVAANQTNYGWTLYTPGITNGTLSASSCWQKRDAEDLLLDCTFSLSASTGTTQLALPSGILSAASPRIPAIRTVGDFFKFGSSDNHGGAVLTNTSQAYVTFGNSYTFGGSSVDPGTAITLATGTTYNFLARIPATGWIENGKAPTLNGSITSDNAGPMRFENAYILNPSGVCSVSTQSSSWISSVSHPGTGQCQLNFTAGTWSSPPICVANTTQASSGFARTLLATTSSITPQFVSDAGGATDLSFNIMCFGTR